MKVTRVLHASVNTAAAIDETERFYRDVLGLAPVWRPEIPGVPGQWLGAGNAQVHLVGREESDRPIDASRHHVCFGVEDLDAALRDLDAAGITYRRGKQHHHERVVAQVFFTDPCGNTIELQEDRQGD